MCVEVWGVLGMPRHSNWTQVHTKSTKDTIDKDTVVQVNSLVGFSVG